MKRTIYPVIDGSYDSKAYTAQGIKNYHTDNKHVSRLLMASQVIIPLIATFWAILIVTYCTCTRSPCKDYLWKWTDEIKLDTGELWEMKVQLSIIFTLSFLFSLYSFFMSVAAVFVTEHNLDGDLKSWYSFSNNTGQIRSIYFIPDYMLIQDSLVLMSMLLIYCGCVIVLQVLECTCAKVLKERFWWMYAAYSIVFPMVNLSIHVNHILIGFIHDQQHALGAGIFYAVLIVTIIKVLRMIAEVCATPLLDHELSSVNSTTPTSTIPSSVTTDSPHSSVRNYGSTETSVTSASPATTSTATLTMSTPPTTSVTSAPLTLATSATNDEPKKHHCRRFYCMLTFAFICIAVFISLTFAFVAAVYIELPINNAFDEAPARVQLIYTTLLTVFIAGFTYWFVTHKKDRVNLSDETIDKLAVKIRNPST